jgi:Ca-activated chloride channel homolog
MRQMNKATRGAFCLTVLILSVVFCSAQVSSDPSRYTPNEVPSDDEQSSQSAGAAPQQEAQAPAKTPSAKAPETQTQPEIGASKDSDSLYTFKAEVQEVVLHATVIDEHHKPVTDLKRDAFHVFDSGKPQRIDVFRQEDVPVALAIVIDNSGSMRDKRKAVNAAALNLVRASNPQDQVCVVNFNNDSYLDQDYTGDVALLQDALERIESRGGTALFDALMATSDHLMKSAKLNKKAILVVTDGEDNASHSGLQQAVRALAVDGGPAIYSIGLLGHEKEEKKARQALKLLSEQTGGLAYFPADLSQVEAISQQIAHEIRNQYTIGYKPSTAMQPGAFHPVVVRADEKAHKALVVRTRAGYYVPGGQKAGRQLRPASSRQ